MTQRVHKDFSTRHQEADLDGLSRQRWMESEGLLRPQRPPESPWEKWVKAVVIKSLSRHTEKTQTFVVDLVGEVLRENNKNWMKIISGLRAEVQELRQQLEDLKK
jgi:hypothetical protein